MSEHITNSHGKIYSDLAKRLGVIVQQYELQIKEDTDKYETTLYICVLQNLLTQFKEVKDWQTGREGEKSKIKRVWDEELPFWGISASHLKRKKEGIPTIGYILEEIRHILSHPLPSSIGLEYESVSIDGQIVSLFAEIERKKNYSELNYRMKT